MTEAAEMRAGARILRGRPGASEYDQAVAYHLEYAAERVESCPKATGPMTQGALRIARAAGTAPDVGRALQIAREFGGIDGDHHKTWVIDQMVAALTGQPASGRGIAP
jgi:hypothetical protein